MKIEKYDGQVKFKYFNNKGQHHMELSSRLRKATTCNVLMVEHKSQNLMGRDILAKLGLTLIQQKTNKGKKILKYQQK